MPTVFGKEPTKEELFNIAKEAYEKELWKPNLNTQVNSPSEKDGTDKKDPVVNAFERSSFFWKQIAAGILSNCRSDQIMSLPQRYLKQVKEILLQKDGQGRLGTEMFSKDPVLEIIERDVAQYMGQCCTTVF